MAFFETVKNAVTAREAAEQYGLKVNRSKMACCPFHDDHHPSMIVDKKFYCFACGAKGDAIDLAGRLLNKSPYEAAMQIASDFHLKTDHADRKKKNQNKAAQRNKSKELDDKMKNKRIEGKFERWKKLVIDSMQEYLREGEVYLASLDPAKMEEDWDPRMVSFLNDREKIERYLDVLLLGSESEQKDFFRERHCEVNRYIEYVYERKKLRAV